MTENPASGQPGYPSGQSGQPGSLREEQLLLMLEIDQRILDHSNTLAQTLQYIVSATQRILRAAHVDILFMYADGLRIEVSSDKGEIGLFAPIDQSISGLVLSREEPVLANDIQDSPLLRERYLPRREMDAARRDPRLSVIAAPLTLDGRTIGVINVEAAPDSRYGESHLRFLHDVARQVSLALTHATLFDEDNLRTATDRLLVGETGIDNDVVMRQVLDQILSTLNSVTFVKPDAAEILFADPQDASALVVAYSANVADIGIRVDVGTSVCGEAFRTGRTVLLQRAVEHGDYRPLVEDMRCEMAIPISLGGTDEFPIGVLNLESSRENAFSEVGRVLAERFSQRVVFALAMAKVRADLDTALQDQLLVLAADQVLNSVHRINNHVGAVRAITQDLLEDLDTGIDVDRADLRQRLRLIQESAGHALEIPDELRRRIGAPEESADVNAQVEAGIAAVRIPKNVQLVTDLAPGLPNYPCTSLDLVIENLLLNAVTAMRNQPGSLHVSTALDLRLPREPVIAITVRDTGVGMTQSQVDRLFEPRQPGHRGSGLGFGMPWVRGWVRRAQGLVEVESQPGEGTTVHIRFQIDPQAIGRTPQGNETT